MPSAASISCALAGRWMFRTAPDLAWLLAREEPGKAQAFARGDRDARHRRLSSAGDARRHRGYPRRRGLQGRARRADGGGLGAHARAPQGAGPADHLWHDAGLPRSISASTRSAICPGSTSCRAPACSTASCRRASACRSPTTIRALRPDEEPLEEPHGARTGLGTGRRIGRALTRRSATKAPKSAATKRVGRASRFGTPETLRMIARIVVPAFALAASGVVARAEAAMPLASHRAAYEISLDDTDYRAPAQRPQTPVAASGLIAYEFRGSSCEGYASNFRQLTELQRNEGDPISSDISAVTFEDGDGKKLQFQIDSQIAGERRAADRRLGGARRRRRHDGRPQQAGDGKDRHRQRHSVSRPSTSSTSSPTRQGGRRHAGGARLRRLRHRQEGVRRRSPSSARQATAPAPDAAVAEALGKMPPLAGHGLLFRRGRQGRAAGIHALVRSLRERRLRHAEARLRRVRADGQAQQARIAADAEPAPSNKRGSAAARRAGRKARPRMHRRRAELVAQRVDRRFARLLARAVALDQIGRVRFRGRREIARPRRRSGDSARPSGCASSSARAAANSRGASCVGGEAGARAACAA